MSERPIIFSAPMVRALLDGRKAQTRRILKPQIVCHTGPVPAFTWGKFSGLYPDDWFGYGNAIDGALPCAVGDRLWVREAHAFMPKTAYALPKAISPADPDMAAYYREGFDRSGKIIWRPSIHMPRWASRITLEVTEVRVQRLQDISGEDTIAEGIQCPTCEAMKYSACHDSGCFHSLHLFKKLWNSIHGPDAWAANPWVAVISFKRIT